MKVGILDRNVGMTLNQEENIERCLQFAFDRFASHVRTVDVSLSDINGPRGGDDHLLCRMRIAIHGQGDLVVKGQGALLEAVVAETTDRASQAVSRRLDRLRDAQGTSMSGQ